MFSRADKSVTVCTLVINIRILRSDLMSNMDWTLNLSVFLYYTPNELISTLVSGQVMNIFRAPSGNSVFIGIAINIFLFVGLLKLSFLPGMLTTSFKNTKKVALFNFKQTQCATNSCGVTASISNGGHLQSRFIQKNILL